ncbi:2-dehydro-3-deoxygalactonokinase [Sphingomonas lutea]|uniref:2-dehydro-3-deoxygalactonokinase n=2 Tax=Sphingomonas lutea TaxID=1045317 RepID=A0A7G9SKV9_9SPHN|nr:2-dehydro-3-deoxygalactonokinase [Sphingomonas lutea]
MRWADGLIAVDWGTSNRRAYLLDASGSCVDEHEDSQGILSVPAGGFPAAIAEIRQRLGDQPLLLAGMIGSNRGWVEAPYVPCPAAIDDLAAALVRPSDREAIVPGVSYVGEGRADVMRGEEVQLLGAVADETIPPDALVCHPGTHNKWARVARGRIAEFRTVMTGELFNLLKEHSILADLLQPDVEPDDGAFRTGVDHGLTHDDIPAELFAVRARTLLGQAPHSSPASFTSGLLIGADLRIGLAGTVPAEVVVMGRPELTELYAAALAQAGIQARELDGERCFLAGIKAIAERIE